MDAPAIPPGFVKRLREEIGERTLTVEFDPVESQKQERQCWSILYMQRGQPTWVCDWQGSLDGAMTGLCQRIAKYDYARHKTPRYYAQKLDAKLKAVKEARRKKVLDLGRDYASYSRGLWQAYLDGKPTVGAKRQDIKSADYDKNFARVFGR